MARRALSVATFLCLWVLPFAAPATELSGDWTASPLRVSWAVGDWGKGCGPRPSGGGESGGRVTLTPKGKGFSLSGLGRGYQSNQCWERMPGLSPTGHSASSSTIRTTCAMPPGDPRQARVVTTWHLRGDTLYFDETGQYQFVVGKHNCTASVRRTRVLQRIRKDEPAATDVGADTERDASSAKKPDEGAPRDEKKPEAEAAQKAVTPATTNELPPAPERSESCSETGPPASLEVNPRTKLMRAGEEFTFRAVARDAKGCRVAVDPKWSLEEPTSRATLGDDGRLRVAQDASSGSIEIGVETRDQRVVVTALIVSSAEFERLIAGGDYGALGESREVASVNLTTSELQVEPTEQKNRRNDELLWIVLASLVVVGTAAAALLARRQRPRPTTRRRPSYEEPASDHDAPVGPAGSEAHESSEGADSRNQRDENPTRVAAAGPEPGRFCPICGRDYAAGATFCGVDGARLVRRN